MKITKKQLKEMVRQAVVEQLAAVSFKNGAPAIKEQEEKEEDYTDVNNKLLPPELYEKLKNVSNYYVNRGAHIYSIQNLFEEILNWVDDPMQVVEIIYSALNDAVTDSQSKEKIKNVYDNLVDMAHRERLYRKYNF